MSGICGIVGLDAVDPTLSEIEALTRPLQRRGPDGTNYHLEPKVALGHTLLATTPEALHETLPLHDASGCTITADARLDNREELLIALDLSGESPGDGELILRAYRHWGEACPEHLLGDFAFAIWDAPRQRLFCARDHMGMRQFNYCHVQGRLFAFATEDTALLELEGVPATVSDARIVDFLDDLEGLDKCSTFFKDIYRLHPAHSLTVEAGKVRIRPYWQLEREPRLHLESNEAYADAFMEVFTQAVRCRLRSAGGLGAMLSGGLDSSSIVAVAARLNAATGAPALKTYSAVAPDGVNCPETLAVRSALAIECIDPTLISQADFDGKGDALIDELRQARNPFELNGTMLRCVYLTAREEGIKVVLDGGAGDVVLTAGNRIAPLIARGRLRQALAEANGEVRFWKPSAPRAFRRHALLSSAWVAFAPMWLRRLRRARGHKRPLPDIRPEVLGRVDLAGRRRQADDHVRMDVLADPERRMQSILHPNLTAGRERFDQLAATFAVECRDPFMDIRLIKFCLSLPPEQLQAGGWPKLLLRRSIEPLVPHEIAWRCGKEHLGWDFTNTLLERFPGWRDDMIDPNSPLRRYLTARALERVAGQATATLSTRELQLFVLDKFLRRYGAYRMDKVAKLR